MNNPFNQQIESVFIGDSGSGGAEGLVPAPAAGDSDAGKFLSADGSWEVPSGGGGAVDSVFGRIGNVIAVSGDYNASQVTNTPFANSAEEHESINSQTYLNLNSPFCQEFFGTDFQIAKLPDATTLLSGRAFLFINNSTGDLDIRTVNNGQITVIPNGARQLYQLNDNSTSSGVWNVSTLAPSDVVWGSSVLNLPFLTASKYLGTDANKNVISVDAPTSQTLVRIAPTGAIDGSNTIFTVPDTPIENSLSLYLNGQLLEEGEGNGYTINGSTITLTTAPSSGESVFAIYLKLNN